MSIFHTSHIKQFLSIDILKVISIIMSHVDSIILPSPIESQPYKFS